MLVLSYSLLLMSFVASFLHLGLRLLGKWTGAFFSAKWHYYTYILVYAFFILPYFKIMSLFTERFSIQSEIHSMTAPIQLFIQEATRDTSFRSEEFSPIIFKATTDSQGNWHLLNVIPYLLLTGTLIFLLIALIRNIRIHYRITSICEPVHDPDIMLEFEASKQKLGIDKQFDKRITVYFSPYVSSPFLYGIIRPRVVLPASIEFTSNEYRQIFLHELIHYKRYDIWIKLFLILVNSLHWFNPLAYQARRDIDRYGELSCDEQLVRSMNLTERKGYCELLLSVLWNVADHKSQMYSAFSDKRNDLERRISMILKDKGARRKSIQLLSVMMTLFLILGGSAAVYAGSIQGNVESKSGVVLLSDIKKNGQAELAVEKARSSVYVGSYKEIQSGQGQTFGGYGLKKGDSVTPTFSSVDGLKVYLLEYDDQTLNDGTLVTSKSKYSLDNAGNYYFVLVNEGKQVIQNVELSVQLQVR